jgi:hypothetical protein
VPVPLVVLCDVEPVPLELDVPVPLVELGDVLVAPAEGLVEPDMLVEPLVPGDVEVLDEVLPGVVELPVPLVEVLLLVLPPGVVLGAVVDEVLLESRVVVVTSSRFVQAVSDASAISVMAPAWAIFRAVMADSFWKGCESLLVDGHADAS